MAEKKRAWLYCHIDAPKDEHGCIKGQRKELMNYAGQIGFEIVGSSEDIGSSLNFDHSGLTEVMKAAEAGKMDVLLVKEISRFGRDTSKTMACVRKLNKLGIRIYSPLEGEIKFNQFEQLCRGIAIKQK
jgi:DNA invertase Pin-like site-specific DNA recombinase